MLFEINIDIKCLCYSIIGINSLFEDLFGMNCTREQIANLIKKQIEDISQRELTLN